jgi:hypothetical protein
MSLTIRRIQTKLKIIWLVIQIWFYKKINKILDKVLEE